jgi:four helix bundle protein
MSGRFEDLEVWQFSMQVVYFIYELTAKFPNHELYGLTSQMRRAAVSMPSNIAEGKGRTTDRDFTLFLCHARGSVYELQTQAKIAEHLEYLSAESAQNLKAMLDRVGRMLNGLISFTSQKQPATTA